ncbi:MAG: hypothetical protein HYX86_01100 [Chloroflexi bacterium]|nr:hypothetical protein [Chloroflexota bacterium]
MAIDLEAMVRTLVDEARERGVVLRAIGGMAVKMHSPSASHRDFSRGYGDLDVVGYQKQRREISRVFEDLGYVPNRRFNALQIVRQMFQHPTYELDIDVFLDEFTMCHKLNFAGRLELDPYTIPLADLLLTKLQVVQINEKDVKDIYALLHDHHLGNSKDPEVIDTRYIGKVTGDDWGWWKTVSINTQKLIDWAGDYIQGTDKDLILERLSRLQQILEETPKTLRWKARARVGEKVRWYELPEDVQKPPIPGTGPKNSG